MATRRILYIEDNLQNQRLVRKILMSKGYVILEALDGLTGVEMALREKPDLILMDINIPGINGLEATEQIKHSEVRAIPVVAVTANAMRGDRERFLEAGCDDYLQKPFTNASLIEMVRHFIGEAEYPSVEIPVAQPIDLSNHTVPVDSTPR